MSNIQPPTSNNEALQLRKLEPSDLPYLYRWENDASAWSDGANHNPLSQQDLRDYIGSTTGDIFRDGQLRLMAQVNGATIGCVDLFDFDIRNRRAALGVYIAPEYRGRGLGKAVVEMMERYAFEQLDLRLLYAIVAVKNDASSRIYESLKYVPSSVLKAWTLESDAILWQKQKK